MTNIPLVVCNYEPLFTQAQTLACVLGTSVHPLLDVENIEGREFAIVFDTHGVALYQTGPRAPGPIKVDFTQGSVDHRRKFGGGKSQMIAKAVGLKAGVYPLVLDATAGLGKDAFVLASLGCQVQLLERSPIIYSLLKDGFERAQLFAAQQDPQLGCILNRMDLIAKDSHDYLPTSASPDVVFLDPMFPERHKTADVKKDMRAFHTLVGKDEDADFLLEKALAKAIYRVVVKRPRKAPFLAGHAPTYQLEGKSSRFDIYALKKMPEELRKS